MGCQTSASRIKKYEIKALTKSRFNPEESIDLFDEALCLKLQKPKNFTESIGKSYFCMAAVHCNEMKEYAEAIETGFKAIPYLEHTDKRTLSLLYYILAKSYGEIEQLGESFSNGKDCSTLRGEIFGENSPEAGIGYHIMAYCLRKQKKYKQAVENLVKTYQILESVPPVNKDEALIDFIKTKESLKKEKEVLDV